MNNPLFDMTGKVALITGSTKGIGRAIAEEMARLGAKVVISSRKAEACEQVASELKAQGYEAIAIPCHVGKKTSCRSWWIKPTRPGALSMCWYATPPPTRCTAPPLK